MHPDPGAEAACFVQCAGNCKQLWPERPAAAARGLHRVDLATRRLPLLEEDATAAQMFEEALPVRGDKA